MDMPTKEKFERLWKKYFGGSDLPITFFYTGEKPPAADMPKPGAEHRCLIADIAKVRRGKNVAFDVKSVGCFGGKRYLGFSSDLAPDFEYFLSYGKPGKLEGERYKKSPELVREVMRTQPASTAPAKYIVFKRWDSFPRIGLPGRGHLFRGP